jgi:hypothetical protein
MKGVLILSILLCVNITVQLYGIYQYERLVRDVQNMKRFVGDAWDITAGSLPAKARVVVSRGKKLKSWIQSKLLNNKNKTE